MKRTLVLLLALVATASAVGCSGGDAAPALRENPTVMPTVPSPTDLRHLIDLQGTGEITYHWTGPIPGGGPGTLVWRRNGILSRWDAIVKESELPTQGAFQVLKQGSTSTEVFGCEWVADPERRSDVRADCGSSAGGAAIMGGILGEALPLFQQTILTAVGERTVLGQRVPCYKGGPIAEVCVDGKGRVLYFAHGSGKTLSTFEATTVLDAFEAFAWPFDSPNPPTPSSFTDSAERLELPDIFHLR